jgi:hypothetical protein
LALFYFRGMQSHATPSDERDSKRADSRNRFTNARDARNRKVRGLWRRNDRLYVQVRVFGEKSAGKIPLTATTLTKAKEEMVEQRNTAREGGMPKGGVKPRFADYVSDYLALHEQQQSGRMASTTTRERTSLEQWKKKLGHIRIWN